MLVDRGWWIALLLLTLAIGPAYPQDELTCPTCGKKFANGARFCPDDGVKLIPAGEKCPQCSAIREGTARFCKGCGHDFQKPAAPTPTPGERICPKCGKKALVGAKFCSGCRSVLPPAGSSGGSVSETAPDPSGELHQWVDSVVQATSQFGPQAYSAGAIVGPPDVGTGGRNGKAWSPSFAHRGLESITFRFAQRVIPRAMRVYETGGQGFVTRIDALVDGREEIFWEAEDRANSKAPILEAVSSAIEAPVDTFKITVDTKKIRTWTEIDAVELMGSPAGAPSTRRDVPVRVTPREDRGGAAHATPDDCFDRWKQAILDHDGRALASCYVDAEARSIASDPAVAEAIFARYTEALSKGQFTIDSRREENGRPTWVLNIKVKEEYWVRSAKETIRFQREGDGWRLQIERGE